MTVWISKPQDNSNNTGEHSVRLHPRYWDKLHEQKHPPSRREYKQLVFDQPVCLRPGETRVLYVHSTRPGDDAIVYDNSYYGNPNTRRYEDDKLMIMSGRAHVSTEVFGQEPIWGCKLSQQTMDLYCMDHNERHKKLTTVFFLLLTCNKTNAIPKQPMKT
jgi:hypothetical protein